MFQDYADRDRNENLHILVVNHGVKLNYISLSRHARDPAYLNLN